MNSPLRIGIVWGAFPQVAAVWLQHQIVGLLDAGYDVRIFAIRDSGEAITHPEIDRYQLRQRTTYLGLHPPERHARFLGGAFSLAHLLKQRPAFLLGLLARRYFKLHRLLNEVHWAIPLLNTGCDLLHIHATHLMWHAALLYRISPIPVITTVHHAPLNEIPFARCQEAFKWGDLFIAISGFHATFLSKQGCSPQKIALVPNGIDLSRFAGRPSTRRGNERSLRLLTVARLHKNKGIEYGLQAFARLRRELPDYSLSYTIAGNGPEGPNIERLITELGLEGHVDLLGYVDNIAVSQLMKQADMFVLPSIAEGIPTVLIEAQAARLPVVATAVAGVPETIDENRSGFLVPPRDVLALVDRLKLLARSPELCYRMGEAGRAYAHAHFDRSTCIERLAKHYHALAERPRGNYQVEWQGCSIPALSS